MKHSVRVLYKDKTKEFEAENNDNLLRVLQQNSVDITSPCGGKGTCGKCRVIAGGLTEAPSGRELELLGDPAVKKGYRLACQFSINGNTDIDLRNEARGEASIVTEGKMESFNIKPVISKKFTMMDVPDIHDQRPDVERVGSYLFNKDAGISLALTRELPGILKAGNYNATFVFMEDRLIALEPGDTTGKMYGIAVDIGTTTIAAYIYDLNTGKRPAVFSSLNPQKKFGADVISRIEYTMASPEGTDEMNNEIVKCVNNIIDYFTVKVNITREDIYTLVFVGNTTMMHFLLKLPAANIAVSPFIPVSSETYRIGAAELGIYINNYGSVIVFPSVSAYIGADTVAAVLSSGLYNKEGISLLIDIGTNGEIVLGNNEWMFACSTAAGPAFEGANIRNGTGGIKGAIDKISFTPSLEYSTIGNDKAIGICGSGIVDAIAGLLTIGVIDETGRILDGDEAIGIPDELVERMVQIEGKNAFLILKSEQCNAGMDIAITQKDVRELQNAKAAVAAGIRILIGQAGIKMEDISTVYLAGGFGNFINKESAVKIGLLPAELKGRIESVGNAAGSGAVLGLLSEDKLKKAYEIKSQIKYIELSACRDFMDEYIECMMFGV